MFFQSAKLCIKSQILNISMVKPASILAVKTPTSENIRTKIPKIIAKITKSKFSSFTKIYSSQHFLKSQKVYLNYIEHISIIFYL